MVYGAYTRFSWVSRVQNRGVNPDDGGHGSQHPAQGPCWRPSIAVIFSPSPRLCCDCAVVQAEGRGLAEQGAVLAEEKMQLKNALAVALEHSGGLEAALGACQRDAEVQHQQVAACPGTVQTCIGPVMYI